MRTDLTTPEAVRFLQDRCGLRVSRFTLLAWHKRGVLRQGQRVYLPARKVGGLMKWSERDLLNWASVEPVTAG